LLVFGPGPAALAMKGARAPDRGTPNGPIAWIGRMLTGLGVWTASPWAFLVFLLYVAGWCAFDAESLKWHELATIATWLMTLCIQRAEHRDTQALQAKIDALVEAIPGAANSMTHIDEQEPEVIEQRRGRRPSS
jgi:low affinity Fe/Cu permease